MNSSGISFVLVFITSFVLSCFGGDTVQEVIRVQPGAGTKSEESEVGRYKCKFTYEAQGGTHEEWQLSVELNKGKDVLCSVERPNQASYLFFQKFTLELTGPQVSITSVELLDDKMGRKSLGPEEYIQDKTSVSSSGKFRSHLEKAVMFSPLGSRDDL